MTGEVRSDAQPGEFQHVALSYRARGMRRARILGVKPNFQDYPPDHRRMILGARRVLYPTRVYARPLADAGCRVFPGPAHYYYLGDKIRQTRLFQLLGVDHPRTRVYWGRWAGRAPEEFGYPFVAKAPRGVGEGRGVFLIESLEDYQAYLRTSRAAYVQEFLPIERELRVVVVAGRPLTAYWRVAAPGEFRVNLAQGGRIDWSQPSEEGVETAVKTARACGFDDVGLDLCQHRGKWLILEANMHYGLQGLHAAGLSLADFLDRLIEAGEL
jgi:ribosomal protein S6--L-glutamate ligase